MFEDFFENNAPANEVIPETACVEHIKAAVMERISFDNTESEEKKMKHKIIRPFIIAVAAAAVGAGSLASANAATNGAGADSMTKSVMVSSDNGEEQSGECIEAIDGDNGNVVYYSLHNEEADGADIAADTSVNDGWTEVYYFTLPEGVDDSSDFIVKTIVPDEWTEVDKSLIEEAGNANIPIDTSELDGDMEAYYHIIPENAGDGEYFPTETIVKKNDVVYYYLPDGAKDGEDILYDFIFSLEE